MVLGIIATLLGAAIIAGVRTIERKALAVKKDEQRLAEPALAFWRVGGAFVIALIAWIIFDRASPEMRAGFWAVFVTGFINIFILIFMLKALSDKNTDMSLSVPILDTTPAVVVFLSWWILGQKPAPIGYVGIVLLVIGTYILNLSAFIDKAYQGRWTLKSLFVPFTEAFRKKGIRLAFCAAALGCVAINFDGMAARSMSPFLALALALVPSLVVNLIRAKNSGVLSQLRDPQRMDFLMKIYPAVVGAMLCLYWWSLTNLIVPYQATLRRMETLFIFFLAYFLLRERKNPGMRFAATVIIVIGAILVTLSAV